MNRFLFIMALAMLVLYGCNQMDMSSGDSILIVDLNVVAKATGRQELMQKELEFANLQLSEQLKLVASRLEDSVTEEKEKLGNKPTDEELKEFQTLVLQAQQQLQNTKNLAIQQSTEFRSELIQRFRSEISEIAQQIAIQKGGSLVMLAGQETLWFDSDADITDEVIAVMRKRSNDYTPTSEPASHNEPADGNGEAG